MGRQVALLAAKPVGDDGFSGLIMTQALQQGWRLLIRHKKAILFLYLANLMVAGLLLFPFMEAFDRSLGAGLYREQMVSSIDYDWYTLFRDRVTGFASTFAPWVMGAGPFAKNLESLLDGELAEFPWEILSLGGLYVFVQTFLLAAAVGSFALDPKGTSTREFFRNGGTFFGRFFRLSVLALLTFWLINSWIIGPLTSLVKDLAEGALTDREAFYWNLSRYLLLLVIFMVVNMIFDYARIKAAVEDRTSTVLSFLSGISFCKRYFLSAFSLYLVIAGLGVAGVLVYIGVEHVLPQQTWIPILLAILWQQLYLIGRLSVKLFFYTCQMQFYSEREGLAPLSTSTV
jgi:hypothetical protein